MKEVLAKYRVLGVCAALVLVTLVVYGQVGQHEFLDFDDDLYVTANEQVKAGLTREGVVWAFRARRASNWHPLTWLSHMLDCELFGLHSGAHHFVNVVFHLANTLLLFAVLTRMTGAIWRSGFVAAAFALHPLHVESVAWLAERKDVLSTLFWMLTLLAYVRYVERPGVIRYLPVAVFLGLGLMAKPMLVTLPFVLLVLDYWPLGRFQLGWRQQTGASINVQNQRRMAVRLVGEKIPLLVLAAVSCVVTFLVQQSGGAVRSLESFGLKVRTANAVGSYARYLFKMVWPVGLAGFYPYPRVMEIGPLVGWVVLLVCVSVLAIFWWRRCPWVLVGWLWYVGTLVPAIGLIQVGGHAMADRYTYVPLIGLFIAVGWGIAELAAGWRYRKVVLVTAAVAVLSAMTVCTWLQIGRWRDSITFFEHILAVTEEHYMPHNNLAVALERQGRYTEAIEHCEEALQLNPNAFKAHVTMGNALAKMGRTDEATDEYKNALQIDPNCMGAHEQLAKLLLQRRKYNEAIIHYGKVLELGLNRAEVHNNLAVALSLQGNIDRAIKHYRKALELKPDYVDAHSNFAAALSLQGDTDEAVSHYRKALELKPDYVDGHNNFAATLMQVGRVEEAIEHYQKALRIDPDNDKAQKGLEAALAGQERQRKQSGAEKDN